jgi:hypothetical protein
MRSMPLRAPRYTTTPFPPYRFVPGRAPHPHAPTGHSYRPPDQPPPTVLYYPSAEWHRSHEYLFGCDLYNHGYWWEAHEEWEGLWQLTDKSGVQGRFLQGLIQVSATHLKVEVGHLRGVTDLLAKSATHLGFALDALGSQTYMGLAVAAWYDRVRAYYDDRLRDPLRPRHREDTYPYICLVTKITDSGELA